MGSKGSFSLAIAGSREGLWFDHEIGRGGDIIDFIKIERGCSFVDALDHAAQYVSELRNGHHSSRPASRPAPRQTVDDGDDEKRIEQALTIWCEARPLTGTIAEKYLRSRCIEVPGEALEVLRFHPRCPWGIGTRPAMVALIRDIITDEPIGIHRTALSADGSKIAPKALGLKGGGAIKLSPLMGAGGELLIGEGIETTLSASILGFGSPAWSVIDAGEMSTVSGAAGYLAAHHSRRSRRERSRREGRSGDQSAMGGRGLAGPHRNAVDAGRRLQRRSGSAGGPSVTDRAEPDSRFIVVYETEPEHASAQGQAGGPSADDGRKVLRGILDEIVSRRCSGTRSGKIDPRIAKTLRTTPSKSPPASASRNWEDRQSPGSSSRPGAEDCLTVFCTPCRRTGWRTRRGARCPTASQQQSGKAAKAPSSARTSRCAAISRR